ncbi:MAG TPA: ABC transporter ATP-binding protein [Clostridia bacterium]|nr:ABC transporter ATP-binding protein [Clostridia bacterium]
MQILSTRDLCKTYGKGDTSVHALKSTSISIEKGESVAIIGPSGSGKSTMLHLLGGLDYPTSGTVAIDGTDIFSMKEKKLSIFRRRKIGFVFQAYNLIPVLSVEENIMLPLLLDHTAPDMEYISELIRTLGLDSRRRHLPSQLSGGQQQRVAIGRALATKPAIVLADEPTGNLDSKNSKEVLALLHMSVQRYNQTLIIITHNPEIASTADRVLRIEDGIVNEIEAGEHHD